MLGDKDCCQELNHGVLAVGYDEAGAEPHYVVKNSWGGGWGEEVRAPPRPAPTTVAGPAPAGSARPRAQRLLRARAACQRPSPTCSRPPPTMQGYFKLASASKDPRGACGVLTTASYPTKKSATNPDVSEICGYFGLSECPPASACACNWNFFGLFCLNWGCAPDAAAPQL